MKGGKYLGEGSYGCVVTPSIPCNIKNKKYSTKKLRNKDINHIKHTKNIKNTSSLNSKSNSSSLTRKNKNYISKIIISPDDDFRQEVSISYKISNLDPNQLYFITFDDVCPITKILPNRSDIVSVKYVDESRDEWNELEKKKTDKTYCPIDLKLKPMNLIMEFGGYDLFNLINKKADPQFMLIKKMLFVNFKECFKNLVKGLYKLHQNRIIIRDIKEENIIVNYDEKTKSSLVRYIDFGLSEHLTPEHCSKYSNINFRGTPELIPPEIIIADLINDKHKYKVSDSILLYNIQKQTNKYCKKMLTFLGENELVSKLNNIVSDEFKKISDEFKNKQILLKYFGSSKDRLNGYLQKADVYSLGISIYNFLEMSRQKKHFPNLIINVKKDIKLHNLLKHMIELNSATRYNILDCLKHPYFN